MRILLLAGSSEATALAGGLDRVAGLEVVTSFAGRTSAPAATGRRRVGGFGGPDGLARWLVAERVDAVVDATHPFAAQMPFHAAKAAAACGVPRLRVCRPAWAPGAGDRWVDARNLGEAADALEASQARRVFLTTGRQELAPFARLRQVWFLARSIEAPDPMPLAQASVLLARGPFTERGEHQLLVEHRIDTLVSKNSGGSATAAKLAAARALGLPVVMVRRPSGPAGPQVGTVAGAIEWCRSTLGLAV